MREDKKRNAQEHGSLPRNHSDTKTVMKKKSSSHQSELLAAPRRLMAAFRISRHG